MKEPLAQSYIKKLRESKNICDDVENRLKISENDIKNSNDKRYFSAEDLLENFLCPQVTKTNIENAL